MSKNPLLLTAKQVLAFLFLPIFVLFVAIFSHGQFSRYSDIALGTGGISGASIRVCPITATGAVGSCSPGATVFTDATYTTLQTNSTYTADKRGNFTIYAAPGSYMVDVSSIGFAPYRYTVVIGVDASQNAVFQQGVQPGTTLFSQLPGDPNGTLRYCADCAATNPCSGGGGGLLARRENSSWNCSSGGASSSAVQSVSAVPPLVTSGTPSAPVLQFQNSAPNQFIATSQNYGAGSAAYGTRGINGNDLPPISYQASDQSVFSGPVDAATSPNPNYLGTSTLNVVINPSGLPTPAPLVTIIGKPNTTLANANLTVAVPAGANCPGGAAPCEVFVFESGDSTNTNTVAGDFFVSAIAPRWTYTTPTCNANASAVWTDATHLGPHMWFNMAAQQFYQCVSSATGFVAYAPGAVLIGVANNNGTAVDMPTPEPYGMTPGRRFYLYGTGSTADALFQTTGTISQDGTFQYGSCELNGTTTLKPSSPTVSDNTPGLILYCQTPLIIMNNAIIGGAGTGRIGPAGVTGACNANGAQTAGSGGAGGGSGGAATTNTTGCAGAGHAPLWGSNATAIGGGTAGVFGGAAAGVGAAVTIGWVNAGSTPFARWPFLGIGQGFGATGPSGSGNGTVSSGAGGNGGTNIVIFAPAINNQTGSKINCDGGAGGNSGNAAGGGGGGGGGWCIAFAQWMLGQGGLTAVAGAGGTSGTGQAGAAGGDGLSQYIKSY